MNEPTEDDRKAHELMRKELWIRAWCAVAGDSAINDSADATQGADFALSDFDERFKS